MLPVGMILAFASYGFGTWGYILVKGDNITLRQWFSPFHPFTGSLDSNGKVPQGQVFPTGTKGSSASGPANPIQGQQRQNLQTQPNPHGFVQ